MTTSQKSWQVRARARVRIYEAISFLDRPSFLLYSYYILSSQVILFHPITEIEEKDLINYTLYNRIEIFFKVEIRYLYRDYNNNNKARRAASDNNKIYNKGER